jgi:hypothetical protein
MRLPKTEQERDFDRLMRDRKPSVWEDKGSVGDHHFRSLKGAARSITEEKQTVLPPLADGYTPAVPARVHDSSAHADTVPAERGARRPAGSKFDEFMRSQDARPQKDKLRRGKRRSISVPVGLENGSMGNGMPPSIRKLFAQDQQPKWSAPAANECGRLFGERASNTLGANLFRHEREETMKRKAQAMDSIMKSFGNPDRIKSLLEARGAANSILPDLNPRGSNLKLGAGYIKVDIDAHDAGMRMIDGVHKPWRGRDSGGMSPPIKHKARLRQDKMEADESRELKDLMATTKARMEAQHVLEVRQKNLGRQHLAASSKRRPA